ncbi:dipeptide epimerase [Roseiconus nitratireducens]|uniref:Dipeptide epimerase n=1 Tax=Roseiconus nitratireducens TaxID=2605748 RepID=A0A5M6D1G9_9BACT|nr:dipeptide epimerase [Roseiconus nitratireducens]KAA5541347.1 dipeptide epimerase [Roseiconus nitratireducens]
MKMTFYRLELPLADPFTISRSSMTTQRSLIVELEHDGQRGWGEVTENEFYGHTFESMIRSLEQITPLLDDYLNSDAAEVWPRMMEATDGDTFAVSALDIAAHDLQGKRRGLPTWQAWGLSWDAVPDSSFTIGIDRPEKMVAKLEAHPGWPVYKIKLGTPSDLEIVRVLRAKTDATLRVDANCGWGVQETLDNAEEFSKLNVEFIEQPLPIDAPDQDKRRVHAESALPLIADEDCQTVQDVARCRDFFHGVNVKLCKCGGLTPAVQMLREARQLGLKTMVGCMVESSVGISGAAQLLPLLDYADLDGAALLRDEPASGVAVRQGKVVLPDGNGTGAFLDPARLSDYLVVS